MKINVEKPMPVVEAKPGDIAYFDNDYWLIGWWDGFTDKRYYFTSLTISNSMNLNTRGPWIDKAGLTEYLEAKKAVIYDGSKSKLDLVIKEPEVDHD